MASTEKMLPAGMMPGKDEIEKYRERYKDKNFSLIPSIESFDFKTLQDEYIMAFCKRYPSHTGVGYEYPLDPVDDRRAISFINYDMAKRELQGAEIRFRKEGTEKAYKALRTKFSKAIGSWVCLGYVKKELEGTSEGELKRQRDKKAAEDAAWEKERKIREKIYKLNEEDPYFLEDAGDYLEYDELEVLDKMLEEEEKDRRENPEPSVEVQKLRMVRKVLKKNQRDFAKLIDYPVGKYADFENGKIKSYWFKHFGMIANAENFDWFMKLVRATGVNPEWLMDEREDSLYDVDEKARLGEKDKEDSWMTPMFATEEEISKWESEQKKIAQKYWH